MPKFILTFLCFAGLATACANKQTAETAAPPAPERPTTNAAAANRSTAATNVQPAEAVPYKGLEKVDPNAFNAVRDERPPAPADPAQNQLGIGRRGAPDDSVINTTMNAQGHPVETRTFNSHPVLAKVEKITIGKDPRYKVYLRSGKVLDAPAAKMNNFAALAPQNILDAVGQLPKPASGPDSRSADKMPSDRP